jgi:hypothetical protein
MSAMRSGLKLRLDAELRGRRCLRSRRGIRDHGGVSELGPAREFVEAIAAQDWDRLTACLSPHVQFRAAIPSGNPFRECDTAEETATLLGRWFGDADPLRLLDSSIEQLGNRVRLGYRFGSFEEGRWYLVEQQAYADVVNGQIVAMSLVCSGFQPVGEPPTA